MIPVAPRPEPAGFDVSVRRPGRAFHATNPTPNSKEYQKHNYWKKADKELFAAYERICAYSCMRIPMSPGTIDHYHPKSVRHDLAYEWSNLRLAFHKLNLYKGDSVEVADPFTLQPGHFVLDFPSCLVVPGAGLSDEDRVRVESTIRVLKLNADDDLVQGRCDIMMSFADGHVMLPYLRESYPFLAAEIERQGIQDTAATIFKRPAAAAPPAEPV